MFSSAAGKTKFVWAPVLITIRSVPEDAAPTGAVVELSCLSLRVGISGEAAPQAEVPLVCLKLTPDLYKSKIFLNPRPLYRWIIRFVSGRWISQNESWRLQYIHASIRTIPDESIGSTTRCRVDKSTSIWSWFAKVQEWVSFDFIKSSNLTQLKMLTHWL